MFSFNYNTEPCVSAICETAKLSKCFAKDAGKRKYIILPQTSMENVLVCYKSRLGNMRNEIAEICISLNQYPI